MTDDEILAAADRIRARRRNDARFEAFMAKDFWPMAYMSGPTKLSDLQHVTPEQARATSKALLGADFSELERRVAAWHAETVENLKAQGYEPTGDGPLADTWIKKET